MLIDWFTVGAQALNFVILVWLLKRFLYKPILDAVDARETRIAKERADADATKAEAEQARGAFENKNELFDQQRAALLSKATTEAQAERQRLLDEARKAVDALTARRMDSLRTEASSLHQAIANQARQEVFAIARHALKDLAAVSLEDRIGEIFMRRLRDIDAKSRAALAAAITAASGSILVRTAFDLPEAQQAAIRDAIKAAFSAEITPRFETAPDLIGGIELSVGGQKLAWSINDYLVSLEKGVDDLLKSRDQPQVRRKAPLEAGHK